MSPKDIQDIFHFSEFWKGRTMAEKNETDRDGEGIQSSHCWSPSPFQKPWVEHVAGDETWVGFVTISVIQDRIIQALGKGSMFTC